MDKANRYISPVIGHFTDLEVDRAAGVFLYTPDGRKILDFSSGVAVANTGHCHPKVVQAIQSQASTLIHISSGVAYAAPNADLAQQLVERTLGSEASVFFTQSGTEAIEASIKLVRYVSKKKKIAAFTHAFHGRTMGSLSVTYKEKFKKGYENWLIKDVVRLTYPTCFRCPFGEKYGHCKFECLSQTKETLLSEPDVGGVIIEPILGEGGYLPAPLEFIQELRRFTQEQKILLIFDEIQSGFGRTGMLFAMEHYEVIPDVLALAKGMASGLPLGACVARSSIMNEWTRSAHGGTYLGNPVCCAASLATLRVIDEENLLENTFEQGKYLKEMFRALQVQYPVIGDVRGFGLMIGLEIIRPETGEPDPVRVIDIRKRCLERGLLLISCGEFDQVIRLIPPLIITREQVKAAMEIIADSIKESLHV